MVKTSGGIDDYKNIYFNENKVQLIINFCNNSYNSKIEDFFKTFGTIKSIIMIGKDYVISYDKVFPSWLWTQLNNSQNFATKLENVDMNGTDIIVKYYNYSYINNISNISNIGNTIYTDNSISSKQQFNIKNTNNLNDIWNILSENTEQISRLYEHEILHNILINKYEDKFEKYEQRMKEYEMNQRRMNNRIATIESNHRMEVKILKKRIKELEDDKISKTTYLYNVLECNKMRQNIDKINASIYDINISIRELENQNQYNENNLSETSRQRKQITQQTTEQTNVTNDTIYEYQTKLNDIILSMHERLENVINSYDTLVEKSNNNDLWHQVKYMQEDIEYLFKSYNKIDNISLQSIDKLDISIGNMSRYVEYITKNQDDKIVTLMDSYKILCNYQADLEDAFNTMSSSYSLIHNNIIRRIENHDEYIRSQTEETKTNILNAASDADDDNETSDSECKICSNYENNDSEYETNYKYNNYNYNYKVNNCDSGDCDCECQLYSESESECYSECRYERDRIRYINRIDSEIDNDYNLKRKYFDTLIYNKLNCNENIEESNESLYSESLYSELKNYEELPNIMTKEELEKYFNNDDNEKLQSETTIHNVSQYNSDNDDDDYHVIDVNDNIE